MYRALAVILLCSLARVAVGQQGPIETDRPDQCTTPAITPLGWFQAEAGGLRSAPGDGGDPTWTLPDVLLKAGLARWLELRGDIGRSQFRDANADEEQDIRPLVLGLKSGLWRSPGGKTRASLLTEVGVPGTGTGVDRAEHPFGSVLALADHAFSDRVALTANGGVHWDGQSPVGVPVYTLSTAFAFSQRLNGFLELYGEVPLNAVADHRWDTGLTWQLSDDLQLDASGGHGFGDPEWFLNMGVSFRFRVWGRRP